MNGKGKDKNVILYRIYDYLDSPKESANQLRYAYIN